MAEEINEPEEMFQSWDGKPIYAKKAERDVNGNLLELTIVDDVVTAIGGKSVGGGGEPVDAYTKAETNELLDGKQDELPASSASQFLQTNSNNEIIWGALPSSLDEVAIFNYGASIWVSEVSDAYNAGKAVFCSKGQALLPLQTIGSSICAFNGVIGSESTVNLSNIIVAHVELSSHGLWKYQTITIPKPSQSDSGKVLTVNNLGAMVWESASLPVATESDSVLYTAEPNGEASWAQMEKTVYGSIMTDEEGTPILDEEGKTIQDEDTATLWTGFNGKGFGAERAVADENGNNIVTTYATKADVAEVVAKIGSIADGGALTDGATINVSNNAVSRLTTAQSALTLNVNLELGEIANFAVEITTSVNVTLTVTSTTGNTVTTLHPSVAGGTSLESSKIYQVTCVGSCWTVAEFEVISA